MAIDLNKPVTTDNYSSAVLPTIRGNFLALAKMLDGESITGNQVGVKRYNATSDLFEQWGGSAWVEMPLAYVKATTYTAADVLAKLLTVDGSGSNLDADLLDGQQGSFYRSASNLNAGTLPDARFPASLPAVSGANLTGLNASNLASGVVPAPRLSGSYNINAATASQWATARTISLSGDVSGSASINGSSNVSISVTVVDDSHNHVIGNIDGLSTTLATKAGFTTSTSSGLVDFPVGTVLTAAASSPYPSRNSAVTVRLNPGNNLDYQLFGSGSTLTGTWAARSAVETTGTTRAWLVQRIS